MPTREWQKQDARERGYKGEQTKPIRSWAEQRMGKKFPNQPKQERSISVMLHSGYTREQITEKWEELEQDDFWGQRGFDFAVVLNEIGKQKKQKQLHSKRY